MAAQWHGGDTQGSGKYTRSGANHVVERGESLESIADLYERAVSAEDIVAANGISNGTSVHRDQALISMGLQ